MVCEEEGKKRKGKSLKQKAVFIIPSFSHSTITTVDSRQKILNALKANQPELQPLPELIFPQPESQDLAGEFITVATRIGSKVFEVSNLEAVKSTLSEMFASPSRIVSTFSELSDLAETGDLANVDPHSLQDVELAVLQAHFAVAENGALWVSEALLPQRALPFITQHLALIVSRKNILPTMHQAYQQIGDAVYGFGTFIAGPSKTADIEQSLVLGAHGPRSMMVFLTEE